MILLISAVFPPEPLASAYILNDIATALSENWEVKVLTPKPSRPFGFHFNHTGLTNHRKFEQIILNSFTSPESHSFGRVRESYSFGKHAANYIIKHKSEIKCIYVDAWPLLAQYIIIKTSKKYSIPSIIHIDDIYPESLSHKIPFLGGIIRKILLPMDRYILRNASKIIAISENMLTTLVQTRGIPPDKIEIIPNWQDVSEFTKLNESVNSLKKNKSDGQQFTFTYLGNIGPVAGVDFLIRSFAKAELKEAALVIAGAGSKKKKCTDIADSYRSMNIRFCDVPRGKVAEIQQQADVLLLPVKRGAAMSSIPSKLSSYMFSGKPVIACVEERSDTAKIIMKANCGWILPPENIDLLAKTMTDIVTVPRSDLRNLGMNGYNFAIKYFLKENNLKKLVKIINKEIR